MRAEVLKGHLDLLLLASLAVQPAHGYALVQLLRERSGGAFALSEGTVYPALYRLERAKLLSSRWAVSAGRRRRVYSLTRAGRRALATQRQDWHSFAAAVKGVVGA
jgi:PadR family transcriptional regulator PadR